MARYYLMVLNVINAIIFLIILQLLFNIFQVSGIETVFELDYIVYVRNPVTEELTSEFVLTSVIDALRNIFIYLIYFVSYIIGYFSAFMTSQIFSPFPYYVSPYMTQFINLFFKNFLSNWFVFPEATGGVAPELYEVPALIGDELLVFTGDMILLALFIILIVSIIFFIRAIFQNNPKRNFVAIGGIILMIVIPLMLIGFNNMLHLFTDAVANRDQVEFLAYFDDMEALIREDMIRIELFEAIPNDNFNFLVFMQNPVMVIAITAYIYLEISFQINYTDVVTRPSLERKNRLEAQLEVLERESQKVTANVDKIKEEAKAKMEELKLEEKEEVGGFFAKTGERFSYVKEMIRRKKLEEEEKKLITAASKTRRLGRYLDRLFREDPDARDTLTAKSSAPRPKSLATSTAITFGYRLILLVIISFIIIHPRWFLVNVFQLPPAFTESVVMVSPEIIILLLGPFIVLFPVIAWAISYSKHRNLIIRLKQEGRIKDILTSVGDYVKKEEETEEDEEEEITAEST